MERIERHEGETLELGGYTFGIARCRDKHLVVIVNNLSGETAEDVIRAVKRFQAKLDLPPPKDSNTGTTR